MGNCVTFFISRSEQLDVVLVKKCWTWKWCPIQLLINCKGNLNFCRVIPTYLEKSVEKNNNRCIEWTLTWIDLSHPRQPTPQLVKYMYIVIQKFSLLVSVPITDAETQIKSTIWFIHLQIRNSEIFFFLLWAIISMYKVKSIQIFKKPWFLFGWKG